MQASEYERLDRAEEKLWWFRALRLFLSRLLVAAQPGQRTLDIGCGTGGLMHQLEGQNYTAAGMDISALALSFARKRVRGPLAEASANELPFRSLVFDLVTSIDLLEVASVQPQKLISEALRVLKPGGRGIFVMAAHQWLLSEHDRAVNSVRRYNLVQMRQLFEGQSIQVVRGTYLFFLLFPLVALRKLLNRPQTGAASSVSDVRLPLALVNAVLFIICWLESHLLRFMNMPTGSSVVMIVEKNG